MCPESPFSTELILVCQGQLEKAKSFHQIGMIKIRSKTIFKLLFLTCFIVRLVKEC